MSTRQRIPPRSPVPAADTYEPLDAVDLNAELQRLARLLVARRVGLKDALCALRAAMSSEALAKTRGSRRRAAHILGVNRRYVQRLAQELEAVEPLETDRTAPVQP